MAIDLDTMRTRKRQMEEALNPVSTEALRQLVMTMHRRDLTQLRKLYMERHRHVSRTTTERLGVIEAALTRKQS